MYVEGEGVREGGREKERERGRGRGGREREGEGEEGERDSPLQCHVYRSPHVVHNLIMSTLAYQL